MSSAAILAMLAIWICFATIPRQVFSQTILANRMSSFGVANTTDIENKLIIHIDASILSQYTNNSGVYRADKATNYVNNNLVTVSGHTSNSNFPTVTLVHSNVPNNPVYQIDLVRTNGNYLQFNYASTNPNYFADFTAGMTILIGYMSLSANYWERIIDIGNSNIRLARFDSTATLYCQVNGATIEDGAFWVTNDRNFVGFMAQSPGTLQLTRGRAVRAAGTSAAITNTARANAWIGKSPFGADALYNGKITEVLIWNRYLSETELQQVFTYFENKLYSCGPGKYGKATSCTVCPINTYLAAGQFYNTTSTVSACLACPSGRTTNSLTGQSACTCGAGLYLNGANCVSCPSGSYKTTSDFSTSCTLCGANSSSSATGATSVTTCTPCGANSWAPAGSSSCFCNAGYELVSGVCSPCIAGKYKSLNDNSLCLNCSANTFSSTGATTCAACPSNSTSVSGSPSCLCNAGYEPNGSGGCQACIAGKFKDESGNTACSNCSADTFSLSPAATNCTTCDSNSWTPVGSSGCFCNAGSEFVNGSCSPCVAGTYKSATDNSLCLNCSANTFSSSSGATTCTSCPENSVSVSDSTSCICNAGYDPNGSGGCDACSAGAFKSASGNTLCSNCSSNTFSSNTASTICAACGDNSWAPEGSSLCFCNAGYELVGGVCSACVAGTYKSESDNSLCLNCSANTYSPESGSLTCLACHMHATTDGLTGSGSPSACLCNVGFEGNGTSCTECSVDSFKDTIGNTNCISCGPNMTTNGTFGAETCVCAPGFYINGGQCVSCPVGSYKDAAGNATTCSPCAEGFYQNTTGQTSCQLCSEGTFSNVTGGALCLACPVDNYSNEIGASSCLSCVGHSTTNGLTGRSDVSSCVCMSGYYGTGPSDCVSCAVDTFKSLPGNSANCASCSTGLSTGGKTNATLCDVCAAGYEGTAPSCNACQAGYTKASFGNGPCTLIPTSSTSSAVSTAATTNSTAGATSTVAASSVAASSVPGTSTASATQSTSVLGSSTASATQSTSVSGSSTTSATSAATSTSSGANAASSTSAASDPTTSTETTPTESSTPAPPSPPGANPLAAMLGMSDIVFFSIIGAIGAVFLGTIAAIIMIRRKSAAKKRRTGIIQQHQQQQQQQQLGKQGIMDPRLLPTLQRTTQTGWTGTNAQPSAMMTNPRLGMTAQQIPNMSMSMNRALTTMTGGQSVMYNPSMTATLATRGAGMFGQATSAGMTTVAYPRTETMSYQNQNAARVFPAQNY